MILPNRNHIGPVQITEGLSFEWLSEGGAVAYTLTNTHPATLETYIETIKAVGHLWDVAQPYLSLHDITAVGFTQKMRHGAQEASAHVAHLKGYLAVIVPNNLMGNVVRLFINFDIARRIPNRYPKVFFRRDEGLKWLLSFLSD